MALLWSYNSCKLQLKWGFLCLQFRCWPWFFGRKKCFDNSFTPSLKKNPFFKRSLNSSPLTHLWISFFCIYQYLYQPECKCPHYGNTIKFGYQNRGYKKFMVTITKMIRTFKSQMFKIIQPVSVINCKMVYLIIVV